MPCYADIEKTIQEQQQKTAKKMPFGLGFILKFPIFNYLNKLYFHYKIHTSEM